MRATLILLVLLALPATARADLTLPDEVVPGQEIVVTAEAGLAGGQAKLLPDLPGGVGRAVAPVGSAGSFQMPATYECTEGCSGTRRFVPGQRLDVSVCSPASVGTGPILTSSMFCLGGRTVVGGRVEAVLRGRAEPRRIGVLRNARWSAWGTASARARGLAGGRRATAVASRLVDCDGTAAYSTLTVRQDGRTLQVLRDLAPC